MDKDFLKSAERFVLESRDRHLRTADLFRLSLRVFRLRPSRTLLTVLGMSLGIGTVLFLVSLGSGLQFILIGQLAATEDSLITLEAFYPPETSLNISQQDIDDSILIPESAEISPVAEFPGEIKSGDLAAFILAKVIRPNYFRLSGTIMDYGEPFTEQDDAVVVSNTALRLLNLEENDQSLGIETSAQVFYPAENAIDIRIAEASSSLRIVGIIEDEFQPPFVMIPVEALSDKPPSFQKLFVKAKSINDVEPLRDKLIEDGYIISARIDLVNQAVQILNITTIILGIFGIAALLVSAIGMFNTMIIGFLERVFEVGIMKSIGASARDVRNLFLMESLMMGFLGGLGGIVLGVGAGELFNLGLNALARQLGGRPVDIFIYPPRFIVLIILLSGLVGILAGFWPARRASKLSPRQAFMRK